VSINKNIIALALISALSACSDSSDKTTKIDQAPVITETVINGKAIKGVLNNAVVTVYKFIDGKATVLSDIELQSANINTDNKGNYSFTVLDYEGPIKVELSPSTDPENPTTMTCDAPSGCGDTAFGAQIDLTVADPNFKLNAISVVDSTSESEIKVNVSALTHLAAELIEADESGINAESVTGNSAQIASTFGIIGDITQLEPTVTDDASAVAAEDNAAELKYGLINAGIMSALFSGETDDVNVLSNKLAEVAADLVANEGAFLVTQDGDTGFELALAEVLAAASNVAQVAAKAITADNTLTSSLNLAQLETQLVNEQAYQEANVGDDGRAAVVTDVPTDGDAVAKAKAMVDDVRLFTHLFDENSNFQTQGDEYVALLDDAGVMVQAEVKSFELLAQISSALSELSLQYDAGTITQAQVAAGIPLADYLTAAGSTGTIKFEERTETDGILFNVNVISGSEKASLNASAELSNDKKSITLTIDGFLESSGAKFTLNEGSFAKVTLDTATTRDELENDSFEGDIISGELDLAISLAQKVTDLVPNPITFEGVVKTKLILVEKQILDEHWVWDEEEQKNIFKGYGRPESKNLILPEMLTLSGSFSSLEGDLISATLTVNIDDLDSYQAPEFKYVGKEIKNTVNFTFSDDLNSIVITDADNISDYHQSVETRKFVSGQTIGEWTASSSLTAANAEKHYWLSGIERKIITKRFDTGLAERGTLYTRAYLNGKGEFGVRSVRITPLDNDQNGTTDSYSFEAISNFWDDKSYDGTSLETLVDTDGNLLTSDGNPHSWDTVWYIGAYATITDFIEDKSWVMVGNPLTISNGAELLAQTINNHWEGQRRSDIDDLGDITIFFSDEELNDIAAGTFTELTPLAYLIKPLIKDAVIITVSEDANIVDMTFAGAFSGSRTFEGDGAGNFNAKTTTTHADGSTDTDFDTSVATPIANINTDEIIISRGGTWLGNSWAMQIKISPQDNDFDGLADLYVVRVVRGDSFNAAGVLLDYDGQVLTLEKDTQYLDEFTSIDGIVTTLTSTLPYNPYSISSALDLYKAHITNAWDSNSSTWIDNIGQVEVNYSDDDLALIVANTTNSFDGYNVEADDNNLLENSETFLNANAALTLEAILGEYQVKVQLAGERTGLDNGVFVLDMSYQLPGEDKKRSVTIQHNTEEEGKLTAKNFEGVVLVLEEPDKDIKENQVIGRILVGQTAIVAATIEYRDGLIVIVYSNEDVESI